MTCIPNRRTLLATTALAILILGGCRDKTDPDPQPDSAACESDLRGSACLEDGKHVCDSCDDGLVCIQISSTSDELTWSGSGHDCDCIDENGDIRKVVECAPTE